jgi:hypothetical protein
MTHHPATGLSEPMQIRTGLGLDDQERPWIDIKEKENFSFCMTN